MILHLLPHSTCFTSALILSTLLSISSSNLMIMWAALELNLLSLIPLMLLSHTKQETEAAVKYFLAQAFGSALIMIAYLMSSHTPWAPSNLANLSTLILIGVSTKLGAPPMHFWFPQVMASSTWPICITLATWQKVAPLTMTMYAIDPPTLSITIISALSALIGGLGGINQTQINALLAYSSIGHLSWMLPLTQLSIPLTLTYFLVYSLSTSLLMLSFYTKNTFSLIQTPALLHSPNPLTMSSSLLLLSLGGLPPLMGFSAKLLALKSILPSNFFATTPFLILGSVLSLSYYLTLSFNNIISMFPPNNIPTPSTPTTMSALLFIALPMLIPLLTT